MNTEEVLIIGGAGFIGANLALTIQHRFPLAKVTIVDDFTSNPMDCHKEKARKANKWKNLRSFKGEVHDIQDMLAGMEENPEYSGDYGYKYLYFLAACTDTTVKDYSYQMNSGPRLFQAINDYYRFDRIVYASSASVYGKTTVPNKESDPFGPDTPYAFSKVQLEAVNRSLRHSTGFRFFNVYGPGEAFKRTPSMIHQMTLAALRGEKVKLFKYGEQVRDMVHINDVVNVLIAASSQISGQIYNLGSGAGTTFNQMAEIIGKVLGKPLDIEWVMNPHYHYQEYTCADLTLLKEQVDYTPIDPKEGIENYVKYLKTEFDRQSKKVPENP